MHCINHSFSSCVGSSGISLLYDLMCAPTTFLSRNLMRVIGEFTHDCFVMHGMCCAPSTFAIMYLMSP